MAHRDVKVPRGEELGGRWLVKAPGYVFSLPPDWIGPPVALS